MNFKKIKPKTINDNKKKISKNNKIISTVNAEPVFIEFADGVIKVDK